MVRIWVRVTEPPAPFLVHNSINLLSARRQQSFALDYLCSMYKRHVCTLSVAQCGSSTLYGVVRVHAPLSSSCVSGPTGRALPLSAYASYIMCA